MADIAGVEDIELLINTFYGKVRADEQIGFIFNELIGDDWSHHLPVMYNFWNMVLFSGLGYAGNPIKTHIDIDKKIPLEQAHFDRWLALWKDTTDELFAGEKAEEAKNRAMLMANLISMKVKMGRDANFIQ
jgi:hemoglobin